MRSRVPLSPRPPLVLVGLIAAGLAVGGCGPSGPTSSTATDGVATADSGQAGPASSGGGATARAPVRASDGTNAAVPTYVASPTTAAGTANPSASSRAAPTSLGDATIVIDPGHNGGASAAFNNRQVPAGNGRMKACNTSGTAVPGGVSEHAVNFRLATELGRQLRAAGARVVFTRETDDGAGPCVNDRAAVGNRARADAVVSVHADGSDSASARGFHVIRSTTMVGGPAIEAASERLAKAVVATFEGTGMPRSTYLGGGTAITPRDDIAGLNLSRVPAVMLEAGNLHHPSDAQLLTDPAFVRTQARALVTALETWLPTR